MNVAHVPGYGDEEKRQGCATSGSPNGTIVASRKGVENEYNLKHLGDPPKYSGLEAQGPESAECVGRGRNQRTRSFANVALPVCSHPGCVVRVPGSGGEKAMGSSPGSGCAIGGSPAGGNGAVRKGGGGNKSKGKLVSTSSGTVGYEGGLGQMRKERCRRTRTGQYPGIKFLLILGGEVDE